MAEDVIATLDAVIDALHAAGVAYALCGGLAVNLHGHVRATRDIDLLALTPEIVERRFAELEQLARLGASLLEAELPPLDRGVLERRSLRIEGRLATLADADPRDVRLFVSPAAIYRHLGWMPDCWIDPLDGRVEAETAILTDDERDTEQRSYSIPKLAGATTIEPMTSSARRLACTSTKEVPGSATDRRSDPASDRRRANPSAQRRSPSRATHPLACGGSARSLVGRGPTSKQTAPAPARRPISKLTPEARW